MTRIGFTFIIVLLSLTLISQRSTLSSTFKKYEVLSEDANALYMTVNSQRNETINLELDRWQIQVHQVHLFGKNYRSVDARGYTVRNPKGRAIPLSGHTRSGGRVSITIGYDFIYGFIEDDGNTYFIEPLRYYADRAEANTFVLYDAKDVIDNGPKTCGVKEMNHRREELHKTQGSRSTGLCYDVEYGICNDYSMFTKYGSIPQAEAHAIGVTNNVNSDYDDAFGDEIVFVISGQYTIDCVGCDPWSSTTDAGALLGSFRTWAIANLNSAPINISHDVASLWTDRDLNGSTIGVAYNPGLCINNFKYNVLQDWSTNANLKRVLVAHEIGHNFDMDHDAENSGFIMAPSVTNTTSWSASSVATADAYISSVTCLSICAGSVPQANFQVFTDSTQESGLDGMGGLCNEPFVLKDIAITLSNPPTADVKISITPDGTSSALGLSDYEMVTDTVVFTSSGALTQYAQIRIYDDKIEEGDEVLILDLTIESGTANLGPFNQQTMTIKSSGDEVSATCCSIGSQTTYGSFSLQTPAIFRGAIEDARSRIILKATELNSSGLTAGIIDQASLYVYIKNSTGPFHNFRIGMLGVTETELAINTPWYSTQEVFNSDVTTAVGWMDFDFTSDFIWDGTSNIYIDFCFENTGSVGNDNIIVFSTPTANLYSIYFVERLGSNTCSFVPTSFSYNPNIHPYMRFRQKQGAIVSADINASSSGRLGVGETGHFYDTDSEVMVSIKNIGDQAMDCVDVSFDEAGNGNSNLPFGTFNYSDKQYYIDADHNALYELTVYYRDTELAIWAPSQGDLNIIQSALPFSSTDSASCTFVNAVETVASIGAGSARSYRATIFGDGYFALTDGENNPILTEISMSDVIVDQSGMGVVLLSPNGDKYLLSLDNSGELIATLDNSVESKACFEGGDLIFDSGNYSLIFNDGTDYRSLEVDEDGSLSTNIVGSLPSVNIILQSGNLCVEGNDGGFILRNTDGECWKISVSNLGNIIVQQVACM